MTQLILEDVYMPQVSGDRYSCWEDLLGETVTMISGRVVSEIRGKVWRASAQYDWLPAATYQKALNILRSGDTFRAAVLPSTGSELVSSTFLVESLTPATFAFSDNGEAIWRGLAFTLREVEPHD